MSEQSIFLAALELDPAERAAYLSKTCANNERLRTEVEKLLAAHEQSGTFLNKPAIEQIAAKIPSTNQNTLTVSSDGAGTDDNTRTATPGQSPAHVDDSLAFLKPPTRTNSIGRLDHYEVLEKVGAGGFGTVLKVFDDRLHRVVAMKVLAPQLAASGTARARFDREARSAAAVKSDYIVNIHDIEGGAHPYLVMEFVAGQTLQQKLDSTGPLGVKEILRIGHQIAMGLAAAHAMGLVHRDIKPANVLLENGVERVKITDFGLARAADDASISQSGVVAGTPTYMAPEQARGEHVDHRADLFSLGSVMYAMCTGRPPFRASTTMATLKRVCDDKARPIREVNPEVPNWLEAIIAKLHAKNPGDRFQSAKEVAELLQKHLAHLQQPNVAALPLAVVLPSESPRFQVGDRVLAPWEPEWLYVGTIREAKENSLFVAFDDEESAWINAADVRPLNIEKGSRVFGWWNGPYYPATVTERNEDQVHLAYDDGDEEWTELSDIRMAVAPMPAAVERPKATTSPRRQFRLAAILLVVVGLPLVLIPALLFADNLLNHTGARIGLGVMVAGLIAYLVSVVVQMPSQPAAAERPPAADSPGRTPAARRHVRLRRMGKFALVAIGLYVGAAVCHWLWDNAYLGSVRVETLGLGGNAFVYEGTDKYALPHDHPHPLLPGSYTFTFEREGEELYRQEFTIRRGEDIEMKVPQHGIVRFELDEQPTAIRMAGVDWTQKPNENALVRERQVPIGARLYSIEWPNRPTTKGLRAIVRGDTPCVIRSADTYTWVSLFDGNNLDAWWQLADHPPKWQIDYGILLGSGGPGQLCTVRDNYRNFQLRAEVAIGKGADSSICFRATKHGSPGPGLPRNPTGYTVDLREGENVHTGPISFLDPRNGAWTTEGANSIVKPDEWFNLEISAVGNRLVSKINGETAVQFDESTNAFQKGHIALQMWKPDTVVKFRKIEIRELPSNESDPESTIVFPNPGTLAAYENKTGKDYRFDVIGSVDGTVRGTGLYTTDSDLAAAAVHGGFLKPGQRGILHVSILPAHNNFRGSTSNGVTSMNWGNHLGSFRVNRLVRVLDTGTSTANTPRTPEEIANEVLAKLTGEWALARGTADDQPLTGEAIAKMKLTLLNNRQFVLPIRDESGYAWALTGAFDLDLAKKQLKFNIKGQDDPAICTYRVDGDKLVLDFPEPKIGKPETGSTELFTPDERSATQRNLKKLGIAMHQYLDTRDNAFPPAAITSAKDGKPLLSWRVALLPHLEQDALYRQFKLDEPWDSEHNKKLVDKMPKIYSAPGAAAKPGHTHYRVFVGPGTLFEPRPAGAKGIGIPDIIDGLANTILVAEGADPVEWTKPDDLDYDPKKPLPKLGLYRGGAHVLMGDGSVWRLSPDATEKGIRGAIVRNDEQTISPQLLQRIPWRGPALHLEFQRGVSAGSAQVPRTAADEQKALRDLVAANERAFANVKLNYDAGKISKIELNRARANVVEAMARLAQTESNKAAVPPLVAELLALWKEERTLVEARVEAGVEAPIVLDKLDARIAEAKVRLMKAGVDLTEESAPLPREAKK